VVDAPAIIEKSDALLGGRGRVPLPIHVEVLATVPNLEVDREALHIDIATVVTRLLRHRTIAHRTFHGVRSLERWPRTELGVALLSPIRFENRSALLV